MKKIYFFLYFEKKDIKYIFMNNTYYKFLSKLNISSVENKFDLEFLNLFFKFILQTFDLDGVLFSKKDSKITHFSSLSSNCLDFLNKIKYSNLNLHEIIEFNLINSDFLLSILEDKELKPYLFYFNIIDHISKYEHHFFCDFFIHNLKIRSSNKINKNLYLILENVYLNYRSFFFEQNKKFLPRLKQQSLHNEKIKLIYDNIVLILKKLKSDDFSLIDCDSLNFFSNLYSDNDFIKIPNYNTNPEEFKQFMQKYTYSTKLDVVAPMIKSSSRDKVK